MGTLCRLASVILAVLVVSKLFSKQRCAAGRVKSRKRRQAKWSTSTRQRTEKTKLKYEQEN
ncbi:hypothetical protein DPV78_001424 [Talaromyces pinophilus]|nr:hypothetical protein DPV78_001424 [Talaromyces pinophilus]